METPAGFEVQAMSDEDYEDLIVEVLYKGEFCLLVSQEEGFENLRVEIHPRENGKPWEFSMKNLQNVLQNAAHRLWELRRTNE